MSHYIPYYIAHQCMAHLPRQSLILIGYPNSSRLTKTLSAYLIILILISTVNIEDQSYNNITLRVFPGVKDTVEIYFKW